MDFYDASSLEDPVERRRALDDLLVPLGHAPGSEVEEIPLHGMRKNDYTPFEYLSFLDEEIVHHINVQVCFPPLMTSLLSLGVNFICLQYHIAFPFGRHAVNCLALQVRYDKQRLECFFSPFTPVKPSLHGHMQFIVTL